jgi:hypothetical protein
MYGSWPAADFPNLRLEHRQITSDSTIEYNCIAWAAGDTENWWWPDEDGIGYWPSNIPRERTLLAFQLAYATLGYVPCNDGFLEVGFEKIALYERSGEPTHAARQLPSGKWTSKLGEYQDIEHVNLECLHGPCYGRVVSFLKRPVC